MGFEWFLASAKQCLVVKTHFGCVGFLSYFLEFFTSLYVLQISVLVSGFSLHGFSKEVEVHCS